MILQVFFPLKAKYKALSFVSYLKKIFRVALGLQKT